MTGQEARDDEREALAGLIDDAVLQESGRSVGLLASARVADAILAAGYRKHPEPEITEAPAFTSNELRLLGAAFHTLSESGWSLSNAERALVEKVEAARGRQNEHPVPYWCPRCGETVMSDQFDDHRLSDHSREGERTNG